MPIAKYMEKAMTELEILRTLISQVLNQGLVIDGGDRVSIPRAIFDAIVDYKRDNDGV